MKTINDLKTNKPQLPIKVVQFGEGNFLRAFADYMIDIMNEKCAFNAGIAIVKPIKFGDLERFHKQNNLYTVVLRGKENGKVVNEGRIITAVQKAVDSENTDEFFALSREPELRFIISNTTEAGIVLDVNDNFEGLPATYPGKLTKFLFERYTYFNGNALKGLIILPVELIENNGGKLKECVLSLCDAWNLPQEFKNWVNTANIFCSTLVDRIVTGYPKADAEGIFNELGYTDELLDVGEPFALWVIESEKDISAEIPFEKAGLPVVITKNQRPFRERKVRVLNGAHTSSVLAAYLCGLDIVRDCMHHEVLGKFIKNIVLNEIVPVVPLPINEATAFANAVFERFENPFIDHALLSISLNSVSKWKARVLPSFKDSVEKFGKLPKLITFSFAALLAFYSSDDLREDGLHAKRPNGDEYVIHDNADVLKFFAENSQKPLDEFVALAASNTAFWGEDLTKYQGFTAAVTNYLKNLKENPLAAVQEVLK